MPQSRVFTLNASHVGFANNLVSIWNVAWIDFVSIGDIEEALPSLRHCPDRFEGLGASVSYSPGQNSRLKVVHCCPYPGLVFLSLQTFVIHQAHPHRESALGRKHQATDCQSVLPR